MQMLPKLPIGIQHFDQLREEGYLYVDKTRQIYELINLGKFVFLSRPRRFGKSLLVTTIKAIYQGRKELFAGLWIEEQIDWETHPVIVLNFNDIDYLSMSLEDALARYMDQLASEQGVTLEASTAKGKFLALIQRLSTEAKVVLLIDEYDKPITDLLENEEKVEEHVKTLKNFYSVLKSSEANHIHFTFLTGVSKYGKIAIFSDLNNLHDITLYPRFATLLGYTQEELEANFSGHLMRLAETFGSDRQAMLERVKYWYNGYSWDAVNMEGFISVLRSIFGGIPHTLFLAEEAYYYSVVYLALSLLGFTIYAERLTNLGRIDAVLALDNLVYIIEFKMTTSEKAISRIRNKQYALAYQDSQKEVVLLGIPFDKELRNISDWAVEDL